MSTTTAPSPAASQQPTRYYAPSPLAAAKVDAEAGILRDVAIMSIGEAAGHDCDVDMVTLQKLFELTQGRSIKAFINHDWCPSPTEVVGIFTGCYIDAATGTFRAAQFTALKAFRAHNAKAYDTLFELAATAPDSFGVSVSIYQELAWVMEDGREVLTDGWAPRPEGSVNASPLIRPTSIESADFVSSPAANKALFQSKSGVDKPGEPAQQQKSPIETKSQQDAKNARALHLSTMSILKTLHAKYGKTPAHLAKAIAYADANPDATAEDVVAKTDLAISEEEQAAMIEENTALKAEVETLKAKIAELEGTATTDKEEMSKLSKERDDLKEEVAQLSKKKRFGTSAIVTEQKVPEGEKPKELTGLSRVVAHFQKKEQAAHA